MFEAEEYDIKNWSQQKQQDAEKKKRPASPSLGGNIFARLINHPNTRPCLLTLMPIRRHDLPPCFLQEKDARRIIAGAGSTLNSWNSSSRRLTDAVESD